jgi:hypothetical protein
MLMVLLLYWLSSSIDEWSHIPSPCGAALLPLPLGTGHETNIFVTMILLCFCFKILMFFTVSILNIVSPMMKPLFKHHLSGLNGFLSLADILQF